MSVILLYRKNKRIVSLNAIYDSFVIQDGKRVPDSEQRKIDEILKNVRKFRMEWEETKHGLLHAEQEIHRKEKLLEESSAESLELRKELESAKQAMKRISLEAQEKMQMGAELMREAYKSGRITKNQVNKRGYNKFLEISKDIEVVKVCIGDVALESVPLAVLCNLL